MLTLGDPAPNFRVRSSVNPQFCFDTAAGRYIVLSFLGSSQTPQSEQFLRQVAQRSKWFDATSVIFLGVSIDPADVQRLTHQDPGRIYFYDVDQSVSRLYGALPGHAPAGAGEASAADQSAYIPQTFVLDPAMRVVAIIPMSVDVEAQMQAIASLLHSLPRPAAMTGLPPVLVVPYVFEPEFCEELIQYYETKGGSDSGFMRDVDGKTVGIYDYAHKRRMDCEIVDQAIIRRAHNRLLRRVIPAISQAYQFNVTRIERHIIACYDAAQGAHFRAHRDNTTLGTAHRRFAVTLNLNSPDYEGGEIWFPEFGPRKYKAPSGAAIIFSCSLLHEVPAVTRGKRYAFLPFLYDDAAAAVREQNRRHLDARNITTITQPAECNATPKSPLAGSPNAPILDGSCGCGNPEGCNTCLSAATYQIGTPAARPPQSPRS